MILNPKKKIQKKIRASSGVSVRTQILSTSINKDYKSHQKIQDQSKIRSAGSYGAGDQPIKIIGFRFDEDHGIVYCIDWKVRSNGCKPEESYVPRNDVMKRNAALVVAYYEAQVLGAKDLFISH